MTSFCPTPSSPLGIGVIGAGGIARRRTIPAMAEAPSCRLAAVMDVAGIETIASECGAPAAYTSVDELLADPGVEAVYVATPVYLHRAQVEACAAARKPVLCEKPMALTLADAEAMATACREAGVLLQEAYMMPFHGAHQAMKRIIDAGRIGKVVSARAQLSCWYPPIQGAWRQQQALGGGGVLMDLATHLYHLIEFLIAPIAQLTAMTGHLVHNYETEDASATLLRLENGALVTVDCCFCIPDAASRNRLEIYGSQGTLVSEGTIGQDSGGSLWGYFEEQNSGYDAAQTERRDTYAPLAFEAMNPYAAELETFASAVRSGANLSGERPHETVRMMTHIEEAYCSAASQERGIQA
jgi:predicted dehydrogenase